MSILQSQVIAFMREFNQDIAPSPSVPDKKIIDLRVRLIAEEAFELFKSLYGSQPEWAMCESLIANVLLQKEPKVNLAEFADACGDLDYVVEGARLAFGIDGDSVADAIQAANMAKVGGKTGPDGKKLKPLQWSPPDIEGVLAKQASGEIPNVASKLGRKCTHCGSRIGRLFFAVQGMPGEFCSNECANFKPLEGVKPGCDHGVVFDEFSAKGMTTKEIRNRWPRGWFTEDKPCSKCGFVGVGYASMAHYRSVGW